MHNGIGWILHGSGKMSEALQHYEAAKSLFQELMNKFPSEKVPRTRSELANTLVNIAEVQRRQGRLAEARANCDAAIAMREAVIKDFPEVLSYRVGMGECLMRLGQVKLGTGDIAGAASDWRRAIALHAGLPRSGGETAMIEAGYHALLSSLAGMTDSGVSADDGRAEQEKAMTLLRRAVGEGYRAPELRQESCLEPLRNRSDFQLLMMDVVFPASPFSKVTEADP